EFLRARIGPRTFASCRVSFLSDVNWLTDSRRVMRSRCAIVPVVHVPILLIERNVMKLFRRSLVISRHLHAMNRRRKRAIFFEALEPRNLLAGDATIYNNFADSIGMTVYDATEGNPIHLLLGGNVCSEFEDSVEGSWWVDDPNGAGISGSGWFSFGHL